MIFRLRVVACRLAVCLLLCIGGLSFPSTFLQAQPTPISSQTPLPEASQVQQTFVLENGLQVTVLPYARPDVAVGAVLEAGRAHAAPEPWADWLAAAFTRSTAPRLETRVTLDHLRITGEVASDSLAILVETLARTLRTPDVRAARMARPSQIGASDASNASPLAALRQRADRTLRASLFGDHPYGTAHLPSAGDAPAPTRQALADFYAAHAGAARTHVFVAGGAAPETVRNLMQTHFGDWVSGPTGPVRAPAPTPPARLQVVDAPDTDRAVLSLGQRVIPPDHPDYAALHVATTLLGGAYVSRVSDRLRVQIGTDGQARSQILSHARATYWRQHMIVPVESTQTAVRILYDALRELRDTLPPAAEVQTAQDYLARSLAMQDATPTGVVHHLADLSVHDLGPEALKQQIDQVYAVTPADVQRVVKTYLTPASLHLVAVGPAGQLQKQLLPFRPSTP